MKLIAWNVGHRAAQRKVSPQMASALNSLAPDVIVLTEYVHSSRCEPFIAELAEYGYSHSLMSSITPRQNQVLIASRTRLEPGKIIAPPIDPYLPSNVLHVRLPDDGLEVLGVRVPAYKTTSEKNRCWDWLVSTAMGMSGTPSVMMGDFNADVDGPGAKVSRIGRLLQPGWRHALPTEGHSYYGLTGSTSRIDHAFVSGQTVIRSAEYVSRRDPYNFCELDGGDRFSDHAPLVIEVEVKTNANTSPLH